MNFKKGTEKKEKKKYEFNGKEYVRLLRAEKKEKTQKISRRKWFYR